MERKPVLSTLWIFLVLNFAYADIFGLHDAAYLRDVLAGHAGGIDFTPAFLLGASILLEVPIAMVLLSRVLNYRSNRWANIAAGTLIAVVQATSLFVGTSPTPSYIFFSVIEIVTLVFVVWYAWSWPNPEIQTTSVEPSQMRR